MAVSTSKFLSLVLRHRPDKIGIELDKQGWTSVPDLLAKASVAGVVISVEQLRSIVAGDDKQRFALSDDGLRIRASQGHSAKVDLGLTPQEPPEKLFHGTIASFTRAIRREGLLRGTRLHVHLSPDQKTAKTVGARRGRPIVLEVKARSMAKAGHVFFRSANGVWLTDHVPAGFIVFPPPGKDEKRAVKKDAGVSKKK